MSEEFVERLSVTLKGDGSYESSWIVFKGESVEDVHAELEKVKADPRLLEATALVAAQFKAYVLAQKGGDAPAPTQQAAASAPPATSSEPTPQASQPAPAQSGGGFCAQCGTNLEWKSFTSKAGRDIKGWFCPNGKSKGDGHTSKFA